jgi:type IV fimbrial biogenesis protein FimT
MRSLTPGLHGNPSRRVSGLTLIELLVTVSVLAVLLALGVPSFASLMQRWRVDATIESLVADIRLARSTATRTSRPVVMCAKAIDGSCSAGNDWSTGWVVFSDLNGDSALDAGEPLIVERPIQSGMASMPDKTNRAKLKFRANGTLESGKTSVGIRPSDSAKAVASIVINAMGRIRVQTIN